MAFALSLHAKGAPDSYRRRVDSYIVKPVDFEQFKESARTLGMYWLLLHRPPRAT